MAERVPDDTSEPVTPSKGRGCLLFFLGKPDDADAQRLDSSQSETTQPSLQYAKRPHLLTPAELTFYKVLTAVVKGYTVQSKVRLVDIIEPAKDAESRKSLFNRVTSKHVDFLICNASDMKPLLAVELDDSSHRRRSRRERDAFVDSALKSAGLPILHVQVENEYDPNRLVQKIKKAVAEGT